MTEVIAEKASLPGSRTANGKALSPHTHSYVYPSQILVLATIFKAIAAELIF